MASLEALTATRRRCSSLSVRLRSETSRKIAYMAGSPSNTTGWLTISYVLPFAARNSSAPSELASVFLALRMRSTAAC